MRALVTGCLGNVGRIACEGFQNAGFEVVGLDIGDGCAAPSVEFHRGSVRDYDTLLRVMAGCDTVLHLAAYNHPFSAPEQEMFELNVAGTFHVFKACQALGIRQLTVASSPNAIGYNFGIRPADLSSVPIGGDHPLYTTDMYSFTKENIELIGRYFYRRYGISSIFMHFGLDFTNTIEQWMAETGGPADVRKLHRWVKELMALPGREAAQEVRRIENALNARRLASFESKVPYRNGTEYVYAYFSEEQRIWNYYIHNFLMFLDRRDMAEAFVCAANSAVDGSRPVFIADHKNMLGIPTAPLAELCYPGAAVRHEQLPGFDAVVDYRAAERLIGFRAKHTFRDYYAFLYGEDPAWDTLS